MNCCRLHAGAYNIPHSHPQQWGPLGPAPRICPPLRVAVFCCTHRFPSGAACQSTVTNVESRVLNRQSKWPPSETSGSNNKLPMIRSRVQAPRRVELWNWNWRKLGSVINNQNLDYHLICLLYVQIDQILKELQLLNLFLYFVYLLYNYQHN